MSLTITNESGGQIQINACLHCCKEATQRVVCPECEQCPRCGSSMTMFDHGGDPILARCLACMKGWTLKIRAVQGIIPPRSEETLAFFARDPSPAFDNAEEPHG